MSPEPGVLPANTELDVWPNPATTSIGIGINNPGGQGTVKVFDGEGQVFFTENVVNGPNQFLVDIHAYPDGIYHVVAELDNKNITSKFIKW